MRCLIFIFLCSLVFSCARQGTPSGGPQDFTPPQFLRSNPDTLSLHVDPQIKEIKIDFDEYITLKDAQQQIVVSPPFGASATFLPMGSPRKSILVKLNEPLLENTTYNINFGNAIQDNNEGNKLPNFQYVFSTGDFIDSLQISGKASVLSTKKMSENLVVGLYKIDSSYTDSLILKKKPFYIARPDSSGIFKLNYLHPGKYQMIAFEDEVQNLQFDLGKESFGFVNEPFDLNGNQEHDIQLFKLIPDYRVGKAEQKGYGHLIFRFSGQPQQVEIEPLDVAFSSSRVNYKSRSDSLNFWFNPSVDSISEPTKRLKFLVKNQKKVDTVSLVYNNSTKHNLNISETKKSTYVPGKLIRFTANYPLSKLDSSFVTIQQDSINLPFQISTDEEDLNSFAISFPIELNSTYKMEFLPGAITDFFGKVNDTVQVNFKTKTRNDFGNLNLTLQGKPSGKFWLQFLTDKDEILDEIYTEDSQFTFNYLQPGSYYFKILVDENQNGNWDTGDFFKKRQPEPILIYPGLINVRALWDADETWILTKSDAELTNEKSPSVSEED